MKNTNQGRAAQALQADAKAKGENLSYAHALVQVKDQVSEVDEEVLLALPGCLDGYDEEDIQKCLPMLTKALGLKGKLVCVWESYDTDGYGYGDSDIYLLNDGKLYRANGPLWDYLKADGGDEHELVESVKDARRKGHLFIKEPEPIWVFAIDESNYLSVYKQVFECVKAGNHLMDCDDDGYCNACGFQDPVPEGNFDAV